MVQKLVWAPDHLVEVWFSILSVYQITLIVLDKTKSSLWKLEIGLWTYDLPNHLDPHDPLSVLCKSDPKLVFWPQPQV